MNHNILVLGSNGQLGSELQELSKLYEEYTFFFISKDKLDITNTNSILVFIEMYAIDIMINCAAYTAVDKAESEVDLAMAVNYYSVKNLAQLAKDKNLQLIHISTDYVFDGYSHKPYVETDITHPRSVYGLSKRDGENAIVEIKPKNSIIIRTSWLYSSYGSNFVKTMLRLGKERDSLGVVCDQVGTPTYAKDLAKTILDIIPKLQNSELEIYHYSNEGVLSWYDFAKEIIKMAKLSCNIYPIETCQYPIPAVRPYFSLLNKSKIKNNFNLDIPYWKDSLDECLKYMGERR